LGDKDIQIIYLLHLEVRLIGILVSLSTVQKALSQTQAPGR